MKTETHDEPAKPAMVRVRLNVPMHGFHAGEEIDLPAADVPNLPGHYVTVV